MFSVVSGVIEPRYHAVDVRGQSCRSVHVGSTPTDSTSKLISICRMGLQVRMRRGSSEREASSSSRTALTPKCSINGSFLRDRDTALGVQ